MPEHTKVLHNQTIQFNLTTSHAHNTLFFKYWYDNFTSNEENIYLAYIYYRTWNKNEPYGIQHLKLKHQTNEFNILVC